MWKSEQQQCEVIAALLERVHLQHLWTATGPTPHAADLLESGGGPLSHGQAVMLRVAFDLWNGHGKALLDDVITVLDDGNLRAVFEAIAVGRPGLQLSNSPRSPQ